tara:strand:- start:168 stop:761 length:594 start_codon:yes stop_codon:yes gene_type:complete
MNKIKSIYSLSELHDLIKKHKHKSKILVCFDIDLTIVREDENDKDVLIEPEVTKELFNYLIENNIYFTFVTARFYDCVCNAKKRDLVKDDIKENLEALYPIFEDIGIDLTDYKNGKMGDELVLITDEKGRTQGIMYKGILLSGRKGPVIKHYRRIYGLEKSHPHTIFIDDVDIYLNSVKKYVPNSLVLRRKIDELDA